MISQANPNFLATGMSCMKSVRPMPQDHLGKLLDVTNFHRRMCRCTAACSGKIAAEEVQRTRTSLGCGAQLLQAIPID